jgi:predicted GH43/DUF377 family glycosyl hydrolase
MEDPRLFSWEDKLGISFVIAKNNEEFYPVVGQLSSDLQLINIRKYKDHGKNWIFFERDNKLYFTYSMWMNVHVVCDADKFHITQYKFDWRWGVVKGGTNLVVLDDKMWGFFHSWEIINDVTQYYVGAYAVENNPPFHVVKMSKYPLLEPNKIHRVNGPLRSGYFPCGVVYSGGDWLISAGEMETATRLFKISHDEVLKSL